MGSLHLAHLPLQGAAVSISPVFGTSHPSREMDRNRLKFCQLVPRYREGSVRTCTGRIVAEFGSDTGNGSCPFRADSSENKSSSLAAVRTPGTASKERKNLDGGAAVSVPVQTRTLKQSPVSENGPKSWPVIGTIPEIWQNYGRMHDWVLEHFRTAGLTFPAPMPSCTYFFTADPAVCEYVLKTNFANYPKGLFIHEILDEFLGDGIFNSDGERWKKQRKAMNGEVQKEVLRNYSSVAYRDTGYTLSSIVANASFKGKPLDMQDLFKRMTLDTMCKVALGADIGALSLELPDVEFQRAFDEANKNVHLRFVDPLWRIRRIFNLGPEARFRHAVQYMDKFIMDIIRTRRDEIAEAQLKSNHMTTLGDSPAVKGDSVRADLISRFILLDDGLTDKIIRDDVLSFIMAGRDSTSSVLAWFIYCLICNPDVAEKIFVELCDFEARHHSPKSSLKLNSDCLSESAFNTQIQQFTELLTFEEVRSTNSNFQYLHAAITETIRLYPVVPQIVKGVLEDDFLPSGHKVRKGDLIAVSPYAMGRLECLWGSDAQVFEPERWLNDQGVFEAESPFKFTAFQAGPRSCLGKEAAYLQMKTVMAVLCRFFKFKLVPGQQVKYTMSAILMMKDGMKATVTRRI